jgi:outer membrane lipoprotein-sorting protein
LTATEAKKRVTPHNRRLGLLTALFFLGLECVSGFAQAQNLSGKIPLPPRRPASLGLTPATPDATVPAQPEKPSPAKPAPIPADVSPEELLTMVNEALTNLKQFSAKFSQISGNGQQTSGRLTVVRPGRLRFDYNPPSTITIIADGNSVAVIDSKLNTQDTYSIGLTPLKFLLGGSINLARDFKVSDVVNEGDRIAVYAEDTSTFGGTSRIELAFDPKTLLLKGWTVTDPQGYVVTVALSSIDTKHEPDIMQFVIPENPNTTRKK